MTDEPSISSSELMRMILHAEEQLSRNDEAIRKLVAQREDAQHFLATARARLFNLLAKEVSPGGPPVAAVVEVVPESGRLPLPEIEPPSDTPHRYYSSRESVTGTAQLVLDVVDSKPGYIWDTPQVMDIALSKLDRPIQRASLSTVIYRLKKSGLIGGEGIKVFSLKPAAPADSGGGGLEVIHHEL